MMRRSALNWIAMALLGLALNACADEGVGDPCIPETILCDENGQNCGFTPTESFIETSSVQCRSRLCIVHQLDNGFNGMPPADPRIICEENPNVTGCVPASERDRAVHCTCRCGGPKTSVDFCECPDGFECKEILTQGGDGVRGSYCVRPKPATN
jgi:hypothetical protein